MSNRLNETQLDAYMIAAIAIQDEIGSRYVIQQLAKAKGEDPTDEALESIEIYREQHGSAEYRDAIKVFAIETEKYFASLTEDEREDIYAAGCWDFEWIPQVIDWLQENTLCWWEAPVSEIAKASEYFRAASYENNPEDM